jgi:hypothetical protein
VECYSCFCREDISVLLALSRQFCFHAAIQLVVLAALPCAQIIAQNNSVQNTGAKTVQTKQPQPPPASVQLGPSHARPAFAPGDPCSDPTVSCSTCIPDDINDCGIDGGGGNTPAQPPGAGGDDGGGGGGPTLQNISGPTALPISFSGATNTIVLKTLGSGDGTYSWTSSNPGFTLAPDGSTVTLSSTASGSSTIAVTYTAEAADGGGTATKNQVVTVQVPTTATLQPDPTISTYSNQTETSCDGSSTRSNQFGYQECVQYQIGDQNSPSAAILGKYTANEQVAIVSTNQDIDSQTGGHLTNDGGVFGDMLFLTNTAALPSNACAILNQIFTVNNLTIRTNCLKYTSTGLTITDITATPNACTATCN